MQPLIDADVLAYEASFAAEAGWRYSNGEGMPPFDYVADKLDNLIASICGRVGATAPPILFLTGKTNFRNAIAKRQKYKDRKSNKPYHFKNILAYMKGKYDCRLTEGLEADDLLAIEQTSSQNTIICTRDKDLRQVPGWHYGWELENQPEFGPEMVQELGWLQLQVRGKTKKLRGTGLLFFYSQCITGDSVDSIPGLPGEGPVAAYALLKDATTEEEAFRSVLSAYQEKYGQNAEKELLEQGCLLWMTRQLHEDGQPVLWSFPRNTMTKDITPSITESESMNVPTTTEPMSVNLGSLDIGMHMLKPSEGIGGA